VALEHVADDRLVDLGLVVVAKGLDAAGALEHAERPGVGAQLDARLVAHRQCRLPRGDIDEQVVPGLGGRPAAAGAHAQGSVVGAQPIGARLQAHAPTLRDP
jgi:hypothetical protein